LSEPQNETDANSTEQQQANDSSCDSARSCEAETIPNEEVSAGQKRPKRLGRTPKDFEEYIRESNAQVERWVEELNLFKRGAGPETQKKRDKLRNKISALRSRMKRKKEQVQSSQTIGGLSQQLSQLLDIFEEELTGKEGSKFYDKIVARVTKALGPQAKIKPRPKRPLKQLASDLIGIEHQQP